MNCKQCGKPFMTLFTPQPCNECFEKNVRELANALTKIEDALKAKGIDVTKPAT